jgi:hypothetical protein
MVEGAPDYFPFSPGEKAGRRAGFLLNDSF